MTRYALGCLLLGSFSWAQVTGSEPALAAPTTTTLEGTASAQSEAKASNVAPDTPVITINGLCDNPSAERTAASNCQTVITQFQFEKVIDAVQHNMPARARQEFALNYANALVMTKKAEQMGLDKGANYEEQIKLARIRILSKELTKLFQEKASQVSDKEIEDYYYQNTARFVKAEMDRIHVPKTRQLRAASDKKLSDGERSQESEQTMKEVADNLFARAVAGEEFTKLQADAYKFAGIESAAPNTRIEIRRSSLSPNQTSVMDLKPGEVSSVLADPNGYVIYKVKTKITEPLDQAREEIKAYLRIQRLQDEMKAIEDSATPALNERYFHFNRPPPGMMRAGEPGKPAPNADSSKPDQ